MNNMIDADALTIDLTVPVGQTTTGGVPTDLGYGAGHCFVPLDDGVAGDLVCFALEGIVDMAALTAGVWNPGQWLWWRAATSVVAATPAAATDTLIGIAMAIKTSGQVTNYVKLAPGSWALTAAAAAGIIPDPGDAGAISTTTSGTCLLSSAGAETRTLAVPTFVGQQLRLSCTVYVGDIVVTVASAVNQVGATVLTFNGAGDWIELVGTDIGGTLFWREAGNQSVALT